MDVFSQNSTARPEYSRICILDLPLETFWIPSFLWMLAFHLSESLSLCSIWTVRRPNVLPVKGKVRSLGPLPMDLGTAVHLLLYMSQ